MTYSVPYNTKHRAGIVLPQPLVRVKARVPSRQRSPLSETYAVRALAVCVGVCRMRAFETQTPVQVDSSCLAAVTCLALYAWFPSNLWLYPINASSSWEETCCRHCALHQWRSQRGQTAEEVPHDTSQVNSDHSIEWISRQKRTYSRAGLIREQVTLQNRSHHEAGDTMDRLATVGRSPYRTNYTMKLVTP